MRQLLSWDSYFWGRQLVALVKLDGCGESVIIEHTSLTVKSLFRNMSLNAPLTKVSFSLKETV